MEMTLTAVYQRVPEDDGGGYVAYAEELPSVIVDGLTLDEARKNLRDAVRLLLQARRDIAGKTVGAGVIRETITVCTDDRVGRTLLSAAVDFSF